MSDLKQFIKTTIREFLNENVSEKYKEEYLNYHGNMIGFDEKWNNLTKNDFNKGGILILDQFGHELSPGESMAVKELLPDEKIETLNNSWMPTAYIIKK